MIISAYEVKVGVESVSKPERPATLFIGYQNRRGKGPALLLMIMEVSRYLRGIPRFVYHDLYLGEKALVEGRIWVLTLSSPTSVLVIEGHTPEGVGLRVVDFHIDSHREDDFTPLETIRRFIGVFGSRSLSSSEGRPSSQIGGYVITLYAFHLILSVQEFHYRRFHSSKICHFFFYQLWVDSVEVVVYRLLYNS
ncbi:hypothetical protein Tco_1392226 [Tanacetum coccineum]